MGVFLKWRGDRLSPQWWGFWQVDGKRHEVSVCRWQGKPPAKGERTGDERFEQSRVEAETKFAMMRDGERSAEDETALVQKIHAARYGGRVDRVKIAELRARWDALPHKADLSEGWRELVHCVLKRFEDFMEERFPKVKEAGALSEEHFKAFLDWVDEMGLSGRAWNYHLTILRGTLAKVDGQSRGFREYLARLPKRAENTVHRRPFSGAELEAIFKAARAKDPELYPVLVAAACTALRRGDVCRLRWDAVDLAEGFATVKTTKTGETVEFPIFPPFRAVLEAAEKGRKKGVPYVFPKIALAYARDADGLNHRLGRVLAAAGFIRPPKPKEDDGQGKRRKERRESNAGKFPAPEDAEAAAAMLEDGMSQAKWTAKRKAKARRILALHFEGKNGKEIAEEIGTSKGGVSDYFREMEIVGRVALVSPPKAEFDHARATLAEEREGEQRKHRGSLCGWHSFRTTFCTMALANGVPMEILRKITGHRTGEIVLKHYDRRGRESMRAIFGAAMPKAIAGAVGDTGHATSVEGGAAEGPMEKGVQDKPRDMGAAADLDAELVAVPPELAGMLAGASPEQWAEIKKILNK